MKWNRAFRRYLQMLSKTVNPIFELAEQGYDFEVRGVSPDPSNSVIDLYNQMSEKIHNIPWSDLEKRGWVGKGRNITSLVPFASSFLKDSTGKALFRKSDNVNDTLISFWLTQVAIQAKIKFIDNAKVKFNKDAFTRDEMVKLAKNSVRVSFIKELP